MPHILLLEDNPGDARLISELLKDVSDLAHVFTITHVERVSQALKTLKPPHNVDVILSDITLPDSRGSDTLHALGQAAGNIPIIFMTGTNDEALAVQAMNEGAQDYLIKGRIDGEVLSRSIKYAQERQKFQNQMNQALARAELSQQRVKLLAEQKRQLVKLNRSKDEFISIASHQLRTPATAVKQYLGMVVEGFAGDIPQEQVALLQAAYTSNDRQLEVINQLLKTAQIDSTRFSLERTNENINQLVEEVIAELQPVLDMRSQQVVFQKGEAATVFVDRNEMKLVVENIIENASKYSPEGKQITVTTGQDATGATVTVIDQGVGIDKPNQRLIFEKFTRVDNDLSDTVSGTGLGLYWAKRIMRMHNGKITVQSHIGKGSQFTLHVPR